MTLRGTSDIGPIVGFFILALIVALGLLIFTMQYLGVKA